jgi:hypothetical protein
MYLDIIYVKGIVDITLARKATWGHVAHAAPPRPNDETNAMEVTS